MIPCDGIMGAKEKETFSTNVNENSTFLNFTYMFISYCCIIGSF